LESSLPQTELAINSHTLERGIALELGISEASHRRELCLGEVCTKGEPTAAQLCEACDLKIGKIRYALETGLPQTELTIYFHACEGHVTVEPGCTEASRIRELRLGEVCPAGKPAVPKVPIAFELTLPEVSPIPELCSCELGFTSEGGITERSLSEDHALEVGGFSEGRPFEVHLTFESGITEISGVRERRSTEIRSLEVGTTVQIMRGSFQDSF